MAWKCKFLHNFIDNHILHQILYLQFTFDAIYLSRFETCVKFLCVQFHWIFLLLRMTRYFCMFIYILLTGRSMGSWVNRKWSKRSDTAQSRVTRHPISIPLPPLTQSVNSAGKILSFSAPWSIIWDLTRAVALSRLFAASAPLGFLQKLTVFDIFRSNTSRCHRISLKSAYRSMRC